MSNFDWSTINMAELAKLPYYELPPTYRLQRDLGNGCFLDPPGFPTYFTKSVYTSYGNSPGRGPTMLLNHRVVQHNDDLEKYGDWDGIQDHWNKLMRKLWLPLPIEHERVQAWIRYVTGYFKNCYDDPRTGSTEASDLVTGSPVEAATKLGLATPFPEPEDLDIGLDQVLDRASEVYMYVYQAVEPLRSSTRFIHQFYPEYDGSCYENSYGTTGDWWERHAERPAPEDCPFLLKNHKHGWCQFCGWREDDA